MLKSLTVWITTNCRILKEMGVADHLNCLLRNLYAGQEGTVRTGHGTRLVQNWERSMTRLHIVTLLIKHMQNTSCERLGWLKHMLESRLLGEIPITSDVQMTPHLWQKRRGTEEPLDEGEGKE